MLRRMLDGLISATKRELIERRIYAIEQGIAFANPFASVDETLFQLWRR